MVEGGAEVSLEPEVKLPLAQSNLHAMEAHFKVACFGPPRGHSSTTNIRFIVTQSPFATLFPGLSADKVTPFSWRNL